VGQPGTDPTDEQEPTERFLLVRWRSIDQANDARGEVSPFFHAADAQIHWSSRILPHWSVIEVPEGTTALSREILLLDPAVDRVDREVPIRPCMTTPNDDYWPSQQPSFDRMNMRCVWNRRTRSNVIVAVLDDGVNYAHPDLFPNIWRNLPEVNGSPDKDDDNNGIIDDLYGASFLRPGDPQFVAPGDPRGNMALGSANHGTPMASIMGAVGDNGTILPNSYLAGAFWSGTMLPVQMYGPQTQSGFAAFKGMEYAYSKGARIMNCSFEFFHVVVPDTHWMSEFMRATPDALYVSAAGNDGQDLDDPASLKRYPAMFENENLVVIGNSNLADERFCGSCSEWDGSNWGAVSVDVFATGTVWSFQANPAQPPSGSYASTSNAAAFTSGLAALVWSENPTMTPIQLKQRLMNTADPSPALSGLCVSGARINAAAAFGTTCP
jgi:subtilisin family serine protease